VADLKVVDFPRPSLSDIPAMLRRLADALEAGEHGEVRSMMLLFPVEQAYPALFLWGEADGPMAVLELELAKMMILRNMVQE
jgi:hypothetical protein